MNTANPSAYDCLQHAMQCHQQGNLYDAELLYAQALKLEPGHLQALRLRGILARERGDIALSLNLLDQAVQAAPQSAQPLAERALTQLASGALQVAETDLRAARRLAPNDIGILTNLGALLQHRGHLQAACELYREVLTQDPDDMEVRCNLAQALADTGEASAALAEASTALQRSGEHPTALATVGAVLLNQHRYAEAREKLAKATAQQPHDDMTLVNYALSAAACGDDATAIRALQQAVEANPRNARATADLINALSAAGDDTGALQLSEQFLHHHPGERLVLGGYAQALLNAGQYEAAMKLLDCARLVQVFDYPATNAAITALTLNAQLTGEILQDPSRLTDPLSKSTYGGEQTGELDLARSAALQEFARYADTCIRHAVAAYTAAGLQGHPLMAPAAEHWNLRAWGTVLHAGGQQKAHMHPLGWLSAVYYVSLPADMNRGDPEAGWLEFGAPPERFCQRQSAPRTRYEPRPGRLLVFPSWFWHQTVPFDAAEPRVSIAFDVMPRSRLTLL